MTDSQRFFAPEVIQTSEMDCGPATLKCLLAVFGVLASYGRLREACQTDVDGTSIDTMEEIAVQLGLVAEQTQLPEDHLLLPEANALPAIVVTVSPGGLKPTSWSSGACTAPSSRLWTPEQGDAGWPKSVFCGRSTTT